MKLHNLHRHDSIKLKGGMVTGNAIYHNLVLNHTESHAIPLLPN